MLELAIDAEDIGAIRPFWKAVMAYVDERGKSGPAAAIVDPIGQLPASCALRLIRTALSSARCVRQKRGCELGVRMPA